MGQEATCSTFPGTNESELDKGLKMKAHRTGVKNYG